MCMSAFLSVCQETSFFMSWVTFSRSHGLKKWNPTRRHSLNFLITCFLPKILIRAYCRCVLVMQQIRI